MEGGREGGREECGGPTFFFPSLLRIRRPIQSVVARGSVAACNVCRTVLEEAWLSILKIGGGEVKLHQVVRSLKANTDDHRSIPLLSGSHVRLYRPLGHVSLPVRAFLALLFLSPVPRHFSGHRVGNILLPPAPRTPVAMSTSTRGSSFLPVKM